MIKAAFIFSVGLLLPAGARAQQATQQKRAVIQPGHQYRDTGTHSMQANPAATERRSTASWHYHRGTKRPQVKVQELPERAEAGKPEAGEKSDSTGK